MPSSEDVADWVRDYGDELYRFAWVRLHDEDVAQDLVQESFLAAWRARDSFKGDSSRKTWLIGILKHKIIDHIRKQIRQRKLHDALEEDPVSPWFHSDHSWRAANRRWHNSPDQLCHDDNFRDALEQCLAKLPLRQRQVFMLKEMVGEDSETVCNDCQLTATNLHVLMHRARLALRHCLEKHGFGS
jgi:RNA polymerase sigma-70 factor (ECF subfamily)